MMCTLADTQFNHKNHLLLTTLPINESDFNHFSQHERLISSLRANATQLFITEQDALHCIAHHAFFKSLLTLADSISLISDQTRTWCSDIATYSCHPEHAIEMTPHTDIYTTWLQTLGKIWQHGIKINWHLRSTTLDRFLIPLPAYPFDHQPYWIPIDKPLDLSQPSTVKITHQQNITKIVTTLWKETLGVADFPEDSNFFQLGGSSFLAIALIQEIEKALQVKLSNVDIYTLQTLPELIKTVIQYYEPITT